MHARPGVLHTLGRGARASAHGSDVLLVEHGGVLLLAAFGVELRAHLLAILVRDVKGREGRVGVRELELEEEEYVKYLKYAHENNMSFNELAEKAVKEAMENNEEENGTI